MIETMWMPTVALLVVETEIKPAELTESSDVLKPTLPNAGEEIIE